MLIWGSILFGLILLLFLLKPKSVPVWLFALDTAVILLLLLTNILYVAKIGNYEWHFSLEFKVYRFLTRIPISIFEVRTIVNIALWLFLLVSVVYQNMGLKYAQKNDRMKKVIWAAAVMLYSGVTLLYFNSPRFLEKLYIMEHTGQEGKARMFQIGIRAANSFCAAYGVYTLYSLLRTLSRTHIILKKQQIGILFLVRLFTTLMILSICAFTPIHKIVNHFDIYDFTGNPGFVLLHHSYETLIMLIVVLIIIIVVWFGLDILDGRVFRAKYPDAKNASIMLGDIRHIFHSYKNAMLSLKLLIRKAKERNGTDEAEQLLEDALVRLEELTEKSASVLDIYNQMNLQYDWVSARNCMEEAGKRAIISKDIHLKINLPECDMGFYGDNELMIESLANLLNNASEALEKKQGEKQIVMTFYIEQPWLCISIRDNGVGVEKKNRNKIFRPAFSTKQTYHNWGMGLTFVRNVVKEHSGYINMKSKPGHYTEFQVVLPFEQMNGE